MVKHSLSNIVILLTILDVFVKTHLTAYDSNHGFVSNDHEKYFTNDLSSVHEEFKASIVRGSSLNSLNLKLVLRFEPEFLDFRERPLGVPYLERVTLFNTDSNKSIDMTSISGSTVHFHSSFFEDKRIPPLGNTSFNVVFLGRQEGIVESNLFIHTTEGHFRYKVKGASISSPYRLRPLVGIKLPPNATFSPFIHLYNPYMEPIQILEMYSSGGDFHLELPTGELEGPKNMWEIPPLQTKPIIRVRFHAKTEQNHTAYIRIKLNNTEDILVVPLEVEVTSNVGLYMPQGLVDFGVGGSLDSPKSVYLNVHNSLKKPVRVHNISSTSKSIKIEYENVKIPADTKNSIDVTSATRIATLTLDWKSALENKEYSGKIVVYYRNGKSKIEIPYYVTVLEGGVSFNKSTTTYFINGSSKQLMSRYVVIKNDFVTPLALTNVSISPEAQPYFDIPDFKPIILKPHEKANIFTLNLKAEALVSNLNLRSFVLLKSNISDVEIPLLSYSGKLTVTFPYNSKDNSLNLGLVSLDTKKYINFLIMNMNPVYVNLNQITTSLPSSSIETLGCGKENHTGVLLMEPSKNLTACSGLATDEYVIVQLMVHSSDREGQVKGDTIIETQYERLSIPVHYKAAQGKLEIGPDRLVFDQCFPGKICSHPLRVHSTFNDPMVIENILSMPPDPRLSTKHLGHIMARSTKIVGHLYLDPSIGCQNECYSGLNTDDTARWLQSLTLPQNSTAELDLSLVNNLYNRYLNETHGGLRKWQNLTMRLDTSEVKWHIFKTRVKMSWPSLIVEDSPGNGSVFKFPLTQVGNISYYNITIRNPSSSNLIVQLVLSSVYPGLDVLNDGLPPNLIPNRKTQEKFGNQDAFFFKDNCEKYRDWFKTETKFDAHEGSLPLLLSPNENFTFIIGFKAENSVFKSTYLYVRNNLTVMEVLQLNGQGAVPNFKFGNRKPGSTQPLSFELTEKHLKDCEHKKHPSPNLTVKRTFTARNMGEVPVFINGFFINGLQCEGYGFKVLNCNSFVLLPNTTRKIDIAFTPDFTLAKVVRALTLETSLNVPISYMLVATIPPSYLVPCSMALSRPTWEPYLYYTTFSSMCVLLIFVVAIIIIEAEHGLREATAFVKRSSPTTQATLDLRLVGIQTRTEIHSHKPEEQTNAHNEKLNNITENKINDIVESVSLLDDGGGSSNGKIPAKRDVEKYTVLIPTTGKSRKKLPKKTNVSSIGNGIHEMHRNCCYALQKHKSRSATEKPVTTTETELVTKKPTEIKDNNKKKPQLKKINNNLKSSVTSLEEETSSTTTESSNNEETEKDCSKIKKPRLKRSPVSKEVIITKSPQVNEVCSGTVEPPPLKVETKKTVQKVVQKTKDKEVQENKTEIKISSWEFKPKTNNKNNLKERGGRADKQNVPKKSPVEKKPIEHWSNPNINNNNTSNVATRASPTLQQFSGIWGESKATFSDVVARNDPAPMAIVPPRPVQNHTITNSKPTMYVEPYKQITGNLGPIGSRKNDYYQQENHSPNVQDQFNQLSNSFFSDTHDLTLENLSFGDYEEQQHQQHHHQQRNATSQLLRVMRPNLMCASNNHLHQQGGDPWCCQNTNVPSEIWDTTRMCNLTNENYPNQAVPNQESDYLWGGSSVWQPWTPLETRRMPPGFNSAREMEEPSDRNQTYDLFGMTNIWAQQYPNPWNYPQGQ